MFGRGSVPCWCRLSLASIVTLCAFGAAPVMAQSGTSGTIAGTVRDESGGALPGVTATLSSPSLQVRQLVQVTDASGSYKIVELPAWHSPTSFVTPRVWNY